MERETVTHIFLPVFDENSRVLVLGTIPSPKSREQGFYYGHPRNRFWPVMADLFEEPVPQTVEERRAFARNHGIALWDVLAQCEIHGADDSSIRNPVPNDMREILDRAPIEAVFTTGSKAAAYYEKYCLPRCRVPAISLPSTSPANCRTRYEELLETYRIILKYL